MGRTEGKVLPIYKRIQTDSFVIINPGSGLRHELNDRVSKWGIKVVDVQDSFNSKFLGQYTVCAPGRGPILWSRGEYLVIELDRSDNIKVEILSIEEFDKKYTF